MMNRQTGFLLLILIAAITAFPGKSIAQIPDTYRIDPAKSTLSWQGHRFFGGMHTGIIALSRGTVKSASGKLISGEFQIDMNSIKVTDLEGETAERLATHLKTADFFDVSNFPQATFVLKHIDYAGEELAAVVGEITIRGISQQINFPAEIRIKDGTFHAIAKNIRVDRTVHDSKYGSVNFFRDLGRKIVHNEFVLDIEIVGQKQ